MSRLQKTRSHHRRTIPQIRYRKPDEPWRENLERFKRWPSLMTRWSSRAVYIYSNEHNAYWRPNGAGYTSDGLDAGQYWFEEAFTRTCHCGPEKRIEFRLVDKSVPSGGHV